MDGPKRRALEVETARVKKKLFDLRFVCMTNLVSFPDRHCGEANAKSGTGY